MSGHSKWATIKRKKGDTDAKRGKIFTKLIREIIIAAKKGGGSVDSNAYLRTIVLKARAVNMPQDNIKRAIQRGTGEIEGASYEEVAYEGYGPGGAAVLVTGSTDNKNRTSADIRTIFSKSNGNLGESGCVSWMFEKKGLIVVPKANAKEDELMEIALDLGADDMLVMDNEYDILVAPENFEKVKAGIDAKKIAYDSAEVTMVPKNYVKLFGHDAKAMLTLLENLEDNDDVANVYANFDISDEEMSKIQQ